uniref:Uncharacterized protein n=1 Tax=Rhizophora mucronata TaxID=61149 RepID=A0A2P2P261_RHIMU
MYDENGNYKSKITTKAAENMIEGIKSK